VKIFAKNENKYQDKSRAILNYDSVIGIGDANLSPNPNVIQKDMLPSMSVLKKLARATELNRKHPTSHVYQS
jgi:hypothetical protein